MPLARWFQTRFVCEPSRVFYVWFLLTFCMVGVMVFCMCTKARVVVVLVMFGRTSRCLSLSLFWWVGGMLYMVDRLKHRVL